MKKLFLFVLLFVGIGLSLSAQTVYQPLDEATYKGKGFVYAKDFWMCATSSKNIDMSLEAFGVSVSEQGKWYEIIPGKHTDVAVSYTPHLLNGGAPVSNIFLAAGRTPGVYEFLYINENDKFCDMGVGDQAIFRIYLVPELEGISPTAYVCIGQTEIIDLTLGIPASVQAFVKSVGWSIVVKDLSGTVVAMPLAVTAGGVQKFIYEIDDTQVGPFQGKYTAIKPNYQCASSASITLTTTATNGTITTAPKVAPLTYCLSNMQLTYPDGYLFNPNSVLGGFSAPNGKWSVSSSYVGYEVNLADFEKTGKSLVTLSGMTAPTTITYVYTYTDDCGNASSTQTLEVVLVFGADEVDQEIDDKDTTICRNIIGGSVSLANLLEVALPTGVTWIDFNNEMLTDGTANIANLDRGKSYNYTVFISPAIVDAFCDITTFKAVLTLKIDDVNGYNSGALQLCSETVENNNKVINLSSYITGLPLSVTDPVGASKVKWYEFDFDAKDYKTTPITNHEAYPINDVNFRPGDNMFKFEYGTVCGDAEGRLVASVTKNLTNYDHKVVKYCYEDIGTDAINLEKILGIGGLTGTWDKPTDVDAANWDSPIFNGFKQYEKDGKSGTKEYIFTYNPTDADGCGLKDKGSVTVKVIITPDVVD